LCVELNLGSMIIELILLGYFRDVRHINYRITHLTHLQCLCPICAAKLAPLLSSIIGVTIDDNQA